MNYVNKNPNHVSSVPELNHIFTIGCFCLLT